MKTYLLLLCIVMAQLSCQTKQEKNKVIAQTVLPKIQELKEVPSRITRSIRKDKDGNLLFSSFDRIIKFDGKQFHTLFALDTLDAFDAIELKNGELWIGSTHHGVYRIIDQKVIHYTTEDGLVGNRVMKFLEDQNGILWIGTEKGISQFKKGKFINFTMENGLINLDINTFYEDRNHNIWIGTRGGTMLYNRNTKKFETVRTPKGETLYNIWAFTEDKMGNIWLAGYGGVYYQSQNQITKVSSESSGSLFTDSQNNLWVTHRVGTQATLGKIHHNPNFPYQINIQKVLSKDDLFFGIQEDKGGRIWVGRLMGIEVYQPNEISINTSFEKL